MKNYDLHKKEILFTKSDFCMDKELITSLLKNGLSMGCLLSADKTLVPGNIGASIRVVKKYLLIVRLVCIRCSIDLFFTAKMITAITAVF